jgi:hypothetical protein
VLYRKVKFEWAAFTACRIGLILTVRRRVPWRQLIAAGRLVSSDFAVMAFPLIAA